MQVFLLDFWSADRKELDGFWNLTKNIGILLAQSRHFLGSLNIQIRKNKEE